MAGPGELEGVGEQVDEDLPEERRVGFAIEQGAQAHFNLPLALIAPQLFQDLIDQWSKLKRPFLDWVTVEAGEGEEVINQTTHARGALVDGLNVALGRGRQLRG